MKLKRLHINEQACLAYGRDNIRMSFGFTFSTTPIMTTTTTPWGV